MSQDQIVSMSSDRVTIRQKLESEKTPFFRLVNVGRECRKSVILRSANRSIAKSAQRSRQALSIFTAAAYPDSSSKNGNLDFIDGVWKRSVEVLRKTNLQYFGKKQLTSAREQERRLRMSS